MLGCPNKSRHQPTFGNLIISPCPQRGVATRSPENHSKILNVGWGDQMRKKYEIGRHFAPHFGVALPSIATLECALLDGWVQGSAAIYFGEGAMSVGAVFC